MPDADDVTLPGIPAAIEPDADTERTPRYETANRTQVALLPTDLEALLPPGHAARLVWRFAEGLDLSTFYARINAREGRAGRTPIDPRILVALWLYATIDGVGSARELDRLCVSHDAYRWLCGGVGVNYHTLSDFRVHHEAALDALLTQSIAALRHKGIVTLARVAQDGTRVRASAGVGSFRREATLRECLNEARRLVERTTRQREGGATASEAAQARTAADRLARVEEALAVLPEVAAAKARSASKRHGQRAKEARVSTTDPSARIMKMADGGFRPAYNVHFATDHDSDVIVGVAVSQTSSDHTALLPMLAQIDRRLDASPATMLVDGGFVAHDAIDEVTRRGVRLVAPVPRRPGSTDPVPIQRRDSIAVALWRARMQTEEAKQQYRARGAIAERLNADVRTHRTLGRLHVRGLLKVHSWVLWVALAHNAMRTMGIVPHLMT
jgi:transposase